ncbi:MAG: sodium/proton antiporter, partial [Gammaproteobacteria bacterium]|nr:sodium/proton antiporter [Gammaproteobacteria bacterium]
MITTLSRAFADNFLGHSADWYKLSIVAFLVINPLVFAISPFAAGWLLILEFIFTLAMALKCYPLQPGGLLALEAVVMGMTSPQAVYQETIANFEVILLLMFMVAGIYFMRDLLLYTFTKILLSIKSKMLLSFLFSITAAFLSAFLDALTVTAVLISVAIGFYSVYHRVASGKNFHHDDHDHSDDQEVKHDSRAELRQFRSFLRSLIMHGAVGTALGGVCTLVGEPQNLLIAERAGWTFIEFFLRMAPVTMPVLAFGLITCVMLEKLKWFSYGATLPETVASTLSDYNDEQEAKRHHKMTASLIAQAVIGVILILSLAFHVASVGLVGLMVIVLLTAFTGVIEEHRIGHAFEEALPFTAL